MSSLSSTFAVVCNETDCMLGVALKPLCLLSRAGPVGRMSARAFPRSGPRHEAQKRKCWPSGARAARERLPSAPRAALKRLPSGAPSAFWGVCRASGPRAASVRSRVGRSGASRSFSPWTGEGFASAQPTNAGNGKFSQHREEARGQRDIREQQRDPESEGPPWASRLVGHGVGRLGPRHVSCRHRVRCSCLVAETRRRPTKSGQALPPCNEALQQAPPRWEALAALRGPS